MYLVEEVLGAQGEQGVQVVVGGQVASPYQGSEDRGEEEMEEEEPQVHS